MRVTKEQINQMKKLREEGKTQREISEIMNLPVNIIQYWLNETLRENNNRRAREWYKRQSKEKRRELNLRQKEYRQNYYKNRYHTDEEYRKRRIELSKKGNEKRKITTIK